VFDHVGIYISIWYYSNIIIFLPKRLVHGDQTVPDASLDIARVSLHHNVNAWTDSKDHIVLAVRILLIQNRSSRESVVVTIIFASEYGTCFVFCKCYGGISIHSPLIFGLY
jgi:hypothetical protein